jgi:prepilin-type processing-associated H-X9-DG protein
LSGKRFSIAVAVVLFVLAQAAGFCYVPGTDILLLLAFGWVLFLVRVVPQLSVRWDLLVSTAVYVVALAVGSHSFLRWLYREMKSAESRAETTTQAVPAWRWRWTIGGLTVVLLMFAAGTAAVGIAHQTTWLARSPEPLYRRGSERQDRVLCAHNLRQVGQALQVYANDHSGHFPDALRTLPIETELESRTLVCPTFDGEFDFTTPTTQAAVFDALFARGAITYIYFGKGLTMPVNPSHVLVVEPLENHERLGINVLFADGHVDWLNSADAGRLLSQLGFTRDEPAAPSR